MSLNETNLIIYKLNKRFKNTYDFCPVTISFISIAHNYKILFNDKVSMIKLWWLYRCLSWTHAYLWCHELISNKMFLMNFSMKFRLKEKFAFRNDVAVSKTDIDKFI